MLEERGRSSYNGTGWYIRTIYLYSAKTNMPKLIRTSVLPLYYQLAQTIRKQMDAGDLLPGQQLPSERDLMSLHGVSRNTVRQAIDALEREGLVERDQGRGTFVSEPKLQLGVTRLTSFTEDMQERGLKPFSRLIQWGVEPSLGPIAEQLQLLPNEEVLFVQRLRYADDEPMALSTSYFSLAVCPGLKDENVENQSIYRLLEEKYGIKLTQAEQSIRAKSANAQEASLLNVKPGASLLVVEGTVLTAIGQPVEHLQTIYRSDRYEFRVHSVRVP